MKGQRYIREVKEPRRRVFGMSIAVAAVFLVLLSRLWYLQIIESENLRELSENNRLRFVPVAASRGTILDRNGKVLVDNSPSFSVAVIPQDVKDKDVLIDALARHLDLDRAELLDRWEKGKGRAKYYPIVLASGITRDQLEFLEENRLRLPGLEIEVKPVRAYPEGLMAADHTSLPWLSIFLRSPVELSITNGPQGGWGRLLRPPGAGVRCGLGSSRLPQFLSAAPKPSHPLPSTCPERRRHPFHSTRWNRGGIPRPG